MGVLDMLHRGIPDRKILAVPAREPRTRSLADNGDVAEHVRREIEHFFAIYKELEGKLTVMQGWRGAESAREVIAESRNRYVSGSGSGS